MINRACKPVVIALVRSQPLVAATRSALSTRQHSSRAASAADRLAHDQITQIVLVTSPEAAAARIASSQASILLVELDWPDQDCPLNATNWLRDQHNQHPQLHSVALSARTDADTVVGVLCAGTSGYLVIDPELSVTCQVDGLLQGAAQLASGKPPVSDAVMHHLVRAVRSSREQAAQDPLGAADDDLIRLTRRERDVLELAAKGFAYAEMAELLSVSIHTINTHSRRIFAKLDVNSRAAAVYEATRQGLLQERIAA